MKRFLFVPHGERYCDFSSRHGMIVWMSMRMTWTRSNSSRHLAFLLLSTFIFVSNPPLESSLHCLVTKRHATLACVASVSVRFSSKERGRRVKDRGKNGASKRAGRGWGRKEGNACRQTPWFWKPPTWLVMPEFDAVISCDDWPIKCLSFRGAVMNFRGACVKPKYFFWYFGTLGRR